MFGSIDANQRDNFLGWDTEQFHLNVYETTMCIYEVLKCGDMKKTLHKLDIDINLFYIKEMAL